MFNVVNLKSYKSVYNFSIEDGKLCVILGTNGCGKTTLLKNISGITKAYEGKVFYKDLDILKLNPKDRAKVLAYLPQKTVNINELTVENFTLTARTPYINLLSNPSKSDIIIVRKYLKNCNVLNFLHRKINTLSGGEFKRVEIARVLAQETDVLILDEPTSHLDFKSSYEMLDTIKELTLGKTVLMTLHDPNLALRYADKIICLDESGILDEICDLKDFNKINKIFKRMYGENICLLKEGVLTLK